MSDDLLAMMNALDDEPIDREEYIPSLFPYAGGKGRSEQFILPYIPYTDRFIEVCGGTGRILLSRKACKLEVFNDIHSGITCFYKCIRDKNLKDKLIERLELTIHGREEFNWCKNTWEKENDPVEKAARWYYMTCYSFAGVGRNFGRTMNPSSVFSGKVRRNLEHFEAVHQRFSRVQVECADWRQLFRDYDHKDTVFYIDPPYYGKNIYKHNWTQSDHEEMCQRIQQLEGFAAVSGYDNPIYDKYKWNDRITYDVRISATTKAVNTDTSNVTQVGKGEEEEILWIKYAGS